MAPTSLVTGWLYWAGLARSQGYWNFFGIDQAQLDMSTTDYLVRAVDTIFPLALAVAVFTLAGHRLHLVVRHHLFTTRRIWCLQALRTVLSVVAAVCLALTAANLFPELFGALDPANLWSRVPQLPPLLAMVGTSALGYAIYLKGEPSTDESGNIHLRRPAAVALFVLSFLMVLWLFWETEEWAYARGTETARATSELNRWAVVYSSTPLRLEGRGVVRREFAQPTAGYRYSYSGFKLLRYAKGNYFLLIEQDQRVAVLPASQELRFEFSPIAADQPVGPSPPTRASANVYVE